VFGEKGIAMVIDIKMLKFINEWEKEFNMLNKDFPVKDYGQFIAMAHMDGIYSMLLEKKNECMEIAEEVYFDILNEFKIVKFDSTKSMAEFFVLNILPYLKNNNEEDKKHNEEYCKFHT
jgi:hypothetical protein